MNRITRELVLAAAVCAGLLALAWLCLTPRRARAQSHGWFLVVLWCDGRSCEERDAIGAPFYDEETCAGIGREQIVNAQKRFTVVPRQFRCEQRPLER